MSCKPEMLGMLAQHSALCSSFPPIQLPRKSCQALQWGSTVSGKMQATVAATAAKKDFGSQL